MKRIYKILFVVHCLSGTLFLSSCEKWLLSPSPGVTQLEDFFTSGETAVQAVNAAYAPLAWEFNNTYFSEWFIGDVVSDDALKGGHGIADMAAVYDLENFKTQANNPVLLEFYRAQYQGVARCNLVLEQVAKMEVDETLSQELKDRLVGEARFLRAMYYYRLVRVFGDIPKVDFVIESVSAWEQPLTPAAAIYDFIIDDLIHAEAVLWKKSEYEEVDLGRATKGAAQAMLLKMYLTVHDYVEAEKWGKKIVDQAELEGEYTLLSDYSENFKLIGENGSESIFEIQYMNDPTSDYGEGFGFTRGTFTVILTRSRSSKLGGGWGFNKPTQNLYDEYDDDDPRRDMTILTPAEMETPEQETYLGSPYINRKYAMMEDGPGNTLYTLSHNSRGPINNKVIRYADVLLMYAEACVENNNESQAKWALEKVRERARHGDNAILPAFPNYLGYVDNQDDLRRAIRHERRVELAMEGHRWFDLNRWGVTKQVMDAYKASLLEEINDEDGKKRPHPEVESAEHMAEFIAGRHETFPLPEEEVKLGNL